MAYTRLEQKKLLCLSSMKSSSGDTHDDVGSVFQDSELAR